MKKLALDREGLRAVFEYAARKFPVLVEVTRPGGRSLKQNNCWHSWLSVLAAHLGMPRSELKKTVFESLGYGANCKKSLMDSRGELRTIEYFEPVSSAELSEEEMVRAISELEAIAIFCECPLPRREEFA